MIDLGLRGMNEHTAGHWNYGASVSLIMRSKTMDNYGQAGAAADRRTLEDFIGRKTLTGSGARTSNASNRRGGGRYPAAALGKDLERELIDYMESKPGERASLPRGGLAKSDTVRSDVTPGEFVVEPAVARDGAGFFEAINNLSAPAQALAGRALAGIQGFASGGPQPASRSLPRPRCLKDAHPHRARGTVLGQQKVNATVDARRSAPAANCWTPPAPAG